MGGEGGEKRWGTNAMRPTPRHVSNAKGYPPVTVVVGLHLQLPVLQKVAQGDGARRVHVKVLQAGGVYDATGRPRGVTLAPHSAEQGRSKEGGEAAQGLGHRRELLHGKAEGRVPTGYLQGSQGRVEWMRGGVSTGGIDVASG